MKKPTKGKRQPPLEYRDQMVMVRMTEAERRRLHVCADGWPISTWCRRAILRACEISERDRMLQPAS